MKVRLRFCADIVIEAENLVEAREKWESIPLFSQEAKDCGADFIDLEAVEDGNTYKDIMDEWSAADEEDEDDDPLEGCSEDFRKAIAYVKENISEEDRDIIRAKCSKLYKQHIIPDENTVDDSVITDLLEEYGQDNDLPEGWWEEEYDATGILTII